jgi:spermidine synthase
MIKYPMILAGALGVLATVSAFGQSGDITETDLVFSGTSPYHNIAVTDADGIRTLLFDDTHESRMEIKNPYAGQFEYTEYFQMIWLWKPDVKNILMLGLGGGSTQKAMVHYHPEVKMETAEIDPMVADVAQKYFAYKLDDRQKLDVIDGRQFLRRAPDKYDAILMDAYTQGRYGASIPYELVTKEFFEIARDHLAPNGVLAYNVITILKGYNTSDIVASIYRTLKEVFPQVYIFEAKSSLNIVMIASLKKGTTDLETLKQAAEALVNAKKMTFPGFLNRVDSFQPKAPANYLNAPLLTDESAPVESLSQGVPARSAAPAGGLKSP